MQKRLWSPEEDEKLRNYVRMHGCGNWAHVAKQTGLDRCGKSCRLRWINYLRPDLRRGPFSADEVRRVIHLHNKFGNSWSKIATHFSGRTDNDVKNFWHSYMRSNHQIRMQQQKDWLNLMFESRMTHNDNNVGIGETNMKKRESEIIHGTLHHIKLLPSVTHTTDNNVPQLMSKDQRAYTIDPARVVTGDEGHKDWSSSDHGATTLLVSDNSRARVGYPKEFGLSTINDDRSIDHNNNTNNYRSHVRVMCEREIADASRTLKPSHPSLVLEEDVPMSSISSKSSDFSILGTNSVCPLYPMEDHINTNHIGVHTGMIKAREGLHSIIWGCLNNTSCPHDRI